jgi:hypothetical protein
MSLSRRDFFRQAPGKGALHRLGRIASSLGLGGLIGDDADAPGACEAAGLALGRKEGARSWLDVLTDESAVTGTSGAASYSELAGREDFPARSKPQDPGEVKETDHVVNPS